MARGNPQPTAPDAAALQLLLSIEADARRSSELAELRHLAVNETRKLNGARQIFLVEFSARGWPRVTAISGIATFDPSSVLVDDIARVVALLRDDRKTLQHAHTFTLPAYTRGTLDLAATYPFRECAWVPLAGRDGGPVFAGLLSTRETVWTTGDVALATRLAATYAHAWQALSPPSRWTKLAAPLVRWRAAMALSVAVALAIPVPLTALAPAEVVARDPDIVAAPLDGVIESIEVDTSAIVRKGDVLVRLVDTSLRNRRNVALQDAAVAEARVKQSTLLALSDAKGRYELGIAQADLELKRAELAFMNDQLDRSLIRASRDGMAVFADKRTLIGKPVATGERIMEVADPAHVEVRVDVAAPDAIALGREAGVRVFLDVEPLSPRRARIVRIDYKARANETDALSFRSFAALEDGGVPPRLGLRGTAQVIGDSAPLVLVLLRRPIAAARQWLGL